MEVCGRYTSRTPATDLGVHFAVDEVSTADLGPRYNVAPTDEVYAVAEHGGSRRLGTFRWGLVPPWAGDPAIGSRLINARAETLVERPAYRSAFARRRCLVPADGFYEWQDRGRGRPKQPWYFHAADGAPLAFAGLWESWHPGGSTVEGRLRSCAIVTVGANATVARVHDRMPAVLPRAAWDAWLDGSDADVAVLLELLRPAPVAGLVAVPVGTAVNRVANDGPELLDAVPTGDLREEVQGALFAGWSSATGRSDAVGS